MHDTHTLQFIIVVVVVIIIVILIFTADKTQLWTSLQCWIWIGSFHRLDWIGLDWIGWDDCDPVLICNHRSTVDAASFKLRFMNL